MTERVATTCRICAVGCGTIVELDGDRVVSIIGDTEDPWSAGYTCSKGRAGGVFHDHPDRLDRPLLRRGGDLVPCSWDEALDDIAMRLQALVADHGPDVVADYTGTGGPLDPSGYALAEAFMRNLGSHQRYSALSIDCPSKFLAPLVLVNRRTVQQYNSLHHQIVGRGRPPVPSLLVHPADAATRGLASGDTATVSTARGSCAAVIEVTDAMRAGVVSVPHGFDEANVNRLIPTTSADPLSGMTIVSGFPVDVHRPDTRLVSVHQVVRRAPDQGSSPDQVGCAPGGKATSNALRVNDTSV